MLKKWGIVRGVALILLSVGAAYVIYSVVSHPLDTSILAPALAVTAGFYALERDVSKK